jgi:hypothetical protein
MVHEQRFDQFARALAGVANRRSVMAGLVAGIGALLSGRSARAGCVAPGLPCTTEEGCCLGHSCTEGTCVCPSGQWDAVGNCIPLAPPCLAPGTPCQITDSCCSGYSCFEGICDCPSGMIEATGFCGSNSAPCMGDSFPCGSDAPCCDGFECQEGSCVQVAALVCRAVGEACQTKRDCCPEMGASCVDGVCACPHRRALDPQFMVCNGPCAIPGEQCDEQTPCCDGAGMCIRGVCTCAKNELVCGAHCEPAKGNFQRNNRNCGGRGLICEADQVCCEGLCIDRTALLDDPDHCGSCCTACRAGQICCNGRCEEPFSDSGDPEICCDTGSICVGADGSEICCGPGDACTSDGCCPQDRVCGEECCGDGTFCYCGACVTDLATCESDADCCAGSCTGGFCCPSESICHDFAGNPVCCGGLSLCVEDTNVCVAREYGSLDRPVRWVA